VIESIATGLSSSSNFGNNTSFRGACGKEVVFLREKGDGGGQRAWARDAQCIWSVLCVLATAVLAASEAPGVGGGLSPRCGGIGDWTCAAHLWRGKGGRGLIFIPPHNFQSIPKCSWNNFNYGSGNALRQAHAHESADYPGTEGEGALLEHEFALDLLALAELTAVSCCSKMMRRLCVGPESCAGSGKRPFSFST
jgi:hypothetical protein